MSSAAELHRLMHWCKAVPFRMIGKIRIAHDPALPTETLTAATGAIRRFAAKLVDDWGEPTASARQEWRTAGLISTDVCDDPCPDGIQARNCPVEWLVARSTRYHFQLKLAPSGQVIGDGLDGWSMTTIRPLMPAWYTDVCRSRVAEIAEYLAESNRPRPAPVADPDHAFCPLCIREVCPRTAAQECNAAQRPHQYAIRTPEGKFSMVEQPPCHFAPEIPT